MSKIKEYIKKELRFLILEEIDNIKSKARIGVIIKKFPIIKKPLIKLLSPSFIYYIQNIRIQAPRPTTFLVELINGLDFELIYSDKSFISKITGKKYYMQNLEESERATQAIANLLSLSPITNEEQNKSSEDSLNKELSSDLGSLSGGGSGGSIADIDVSDNNTENLPELQPEDIPGVANSNVDTTPGEGGDLDLDF